MTEGPVLRWRVHLARRRARQAAVAVGVIALGAVAAGVGFRSVVLGLLAAALLVASVGDFLFPLTYTLDAQGASVRGLWGRRHLPWHRVRRVARDELGVKLSPLAGPSRLEAYRGIYCWFAGNEAEVMAAVEWYTRPEAAGGAERPSA
mgnify:CR=1 FL=1